MTEGLTLGEVSRTLDLNESVEEMERETTVRELVGNWRESLAAERSMRWVYGQARWR
jgi:hypothetical protein